MKQYLFNADKWKLVIILLLIYFPLGLYLNFPVYSPKYDYNIQIFYYQAGTLLILALALYTWMLLSEQVMLLFFRQFGEDFLLGLNIIPVLIMLTTAVIMAFGFVLLTREMMTLAEWLSRQLFDVGFRVPTTSPSAEFISLKQRANIATMLLLMLSTFFLIAYRQSSRKAQAMETRAVQLAHENAQAQLKALKDQLSPHFLFNSFSILSNLVHEDASLAEKFILELSKTYRYMLEQRTHDVVPLKSELEFASSYAFLLQLRFKDKFRVVNAITRDVHDYSIAPVTLQLLIENAVAHNQMSAERPLEVTLVIADQSLVVSNLRHPKSHKGNSTGIGLQNIVRRYAALTDRPVVIDEAPDHFTVKIPLLRL